MTDVSKTAATSILESLLKRVNSITDSGTSTGWVRSVRLAIRRIFGEKSEQLLEFEKTTYLGEKIILLESMLDTVRYDWPEDEISSSELTEPPAPPVQPARSPCVFIGHGRNLIWARLQIFLEHDLGLRTVNYESESRVGESIVPILKKMLDEATFAVLLLTAEDETSAGEKRARQNVIHEVGLFQGRLGFEKVVLLMQEGIEEFSNVAGLQYISFAGDNINQTFYELRRALERESQLVKA